MIDFRDLKPGMLIAGIATGRSFCGTVQEIIDEALGGFLKVKATVKVYPSLLPGTPGAQAYDVLTINDEEGWALYLLAEEYGETGE